MTHGRRGTRRTPSDEQLALIEPLLPPVNTDGRPEKHPRRAVVDAILRAESTCSMTFGGDDVESLGQSPADCPQPSRSQLITLPCPTYPTRVDPGRWPAPVSAP
jgi:hypothetical protein